MSDSLVDLKPVYLIFGEEQLLLDQALSRLRDRFVDAGGADFDIDQFDAENATGDAVVNAANTLPFGADRRLVVVRNVDKLAKDGLDLLAAYSADPSPYAVLVLVAPKIAKNTKLYKAVDKIGGIAEYAAPKKREYPSWVWGAVRDREREIDPDAADLLVRYVGYDMRRLDAEIDKLIAFAGERAKITRADVEDVVSATAAASVFEFLDALGERDAVRSMQLVTHLIDDGESVYGLHAMAVRRIRDLMAADSLEHRGARGSGALASELGRPEWMVRALPRQASRFSGDELSVLLRKAAAAEAKMKTSRDARLAFEIWVLAVCGA